MATIVFSHGFGVKSDARGMFTQIAEAFPQHGSVLFDYNTVLENGDIEVAPLDLQAMKLQRKVNEQQEDVIIIAHSQGCIVTGMIDLQNVKKVILLAPPVEMSMQRVIDKLMKKPGAEINLDGISKLPRSDGTVTHISKEYLQSVSQVSPIDLYASIAQETDATIVRCVDDEVLGLTNVNKVAEAKHIDVSADHDFTGTARTALLDLLSVELL